MQQEVTSDPGLAMVTDVISWAVSITQPDGSTQKYSINVWVALRINKIQIKQNTEST